MYPHFHSLSQEMAPFCRVTMLSFKHCKILAIRPLPLRFQNSNTNSIPSLEGSLALLSLWNRKANPCDLSSTSGLKPEILGLIWKRRDPTATHSLQPSSRFPYQWLPPTSQHLVLGLPTVSISSASKFPTLIILQLLTRSSGPFVLVWCRWLRKISYDVQVMFEWWKFSFAENCRKFSPKKILLVYLNQVC